jgi:2-polyprenyl-3-methyl-5-hydroxy-6-metoxy-1,4-benzoquinol methylase
MNCVYCNETLFSSSYLPSTTFNGKTFNYLKCKRCDVIYLDPLPSEDDYFKMYPPSYQSGIDNTILNNPYKKLPGLRFSYGYQFDLIKKYMSSEVRILDYGCGNANFLINAKSQGFSCDGAEFNKAHVDILKKEIPSSNFYTTEEFLQQTVTQYEVIRLSNVLEHLHNPNEVIKSLQSKLTKDGILLLEGPLECNSNLAFLSRKFYFYLKKLLQKNYLATHDPTHITFTNSKNQLRFFEACGLEKLSYTIIERAWPYPESIRSTIGIGGKSKAIIAQVSMLVSKFVPNWGNTFIYAGRKK